MSRHSCKVYSNFEEWSKRWLDTPQAQRHARRVWKNHVARHGNVPMLRQCAVCSGQEQKDDIKHVKWKVARPSRVLRDEYTTYGH